MTHDINQVTKHKTVQEDLQASEIRYRRLFESARDGILILDAVSRKIIDANPFMVELLGYSREEFLGKELWQIGLFKDKDQNQAAFRELQEKGYIRYDNMPLELKTGECREVEFVSNVYREGDRQTVQCNIRDNTEHKRVKEESEQNREWLSAIFEASQDGIVVEENGQIVFVNNRFLRMYGCDTHREVIGNHALRFQKPEDTERMAEYGRKRLRGEEAPTVYEFTGVSKGGREMPIEASISTFSSNGNFYIVTAQRDITERKQSEESLYASRQMLLAVLDSIPQRVFWKDHGLVFQGCNQSFALDMGFADPTEVVGKTDYEAVWKDKAELYRADDRTVIDSGISKLNYTEPQTKLSGELGWLKTSKVLLRDRQGKVAGVLGTYEDITEYKRAEEALLRQQTELRVLFDLMPAMIWFKDTENNILRVNKQVAESIGKRVEEIEGKPSSEIYPQMAAKYHADDLEIIRSGKPKLGIVETLKDKDGRELWIQTDKVPYRNDDEKVIGIVVVARDITESKRLEDELRQSEASLANAQRIAHIGSWDWDIQNNQLFWSDEIYRIFGIPKAQFGANYESFLNGIHPEDRQLVQSAVDAALKQVTPYNIEHRILSQTGVESFVCELGEVTFDESGKPLRMMGTVQDITERKRAEEALKASEAKQRQLSERQSAIFDALPAHISLLSGLGNILDVNAAWRQFASMNNYEGSNFGIGSNYFDVCECATGDCSAEANQTAEGIRSVLSGKSNHFELEYPCHSPEKKRWFRLTVTPLQEDATAGVVVMHVNVTERKLSEEALRQTEAKYRSIVELLPAIVYLAQPFPPYSPIYVSPNIIEFGYSAAEWVERDDMWVNILHEEDRERVLRATGDAISQGLETELEYRIIGRNGAIHWVHDKGRFVSDEDGNKISWQRVVVNITKTKELEEQLRQSQKLESVGRLAGGIAHDFNNMLTVINGYSALTLRRLKDGDPLRQNIEEIKQAGERSAALTYQLLAFSRKQILKPKVLYFNQIIADTTKMLNRLIGEDIQLCTILNPDAGPVEVDPGQLSQVIMNLAVNARDAMPQGGKITIETNNFYLDEAYARLHIGVIPGDYVVLAVSDTGTGIDEETQQHIFEPFFTTKEVGKGTGLGLATVYGIVKQSGGNIWVYSEVGLGTTFKIYLPRAVEQSEAAEIRNTFDELPKGEETILLVEDEDLVRTMTRQVLEMCGYIVLEAGNGVEALSICEKHDCQIDLMITDVVMPLMGGRELAERFVQTYPEIRVLFTSGYTDDAVVRQGVIEAGTNFIEKPFSPDTLAQKVRAILDGLQSVK